MEENFLYYIEHSIRIHWEEPALTDYQGQTHTFGDVAHHIARLHLLFEESGIRRGDKIALCSRNQTNWGIAFLAILSYGAVAVPILHEFKADNIRHIVNHSEARILFAGTPIWEELQKEEMPKPETVIKMEDYSLFYNTNPALAKAHGHWEELFRQKYPAALRPEDIHYEPDQPDQLAMINYTSGTTSASKGVMLSYRSMWSNLKYALDKMGYNPGERLVSILTMAHMYGLAFELIYPFASGTHVYFISKTPAPKIINEIFSAVRPNLIVAVPLIIEKIIKHRVLPQLEKFHIKLFLKIPYLNRRLRLSIRDKIVNAFGGRFKLIAIGGAALNFEVEKFLSSVQFPYTVGYGMTECGPAISYDDWHTFKAGSCGKAVDRMEIAINSSDPENIVGEILVRGANVMDGYYKNHEATSSAIDEDGWLHATVFEYPDPHPQTGQHCMDYSLLYGVTLYEYLKATGDRETAEDLWPVVVRQIEFARTYLKDDIYDMDKKPQWWLVFDWKEDLNRHAPMQGLMTFAIDRSYELARMLGREQEVAEWPGVVKAMRKASRKNFYDSKNGVVVSGPDRQVSYLSQVWMILSGTLSQKESVRALEAAFADPASCYPGSPYAYHYLIEAMLHCGMNRQAKELLVDYWGSMIRKGADTFWEVYDPKDDFKSPYNFYPINSYCHAWSCTPVYFINKYKEIFQQ